MRKDSLLRLEQHGIDAVPSRWTQSRVKYLGAYINGFPFKPEDWGTIGRPILRIQNLSSHDQEPNRYDGEIPGRYLVRSGDILISWSASLGVYRWTGEEAWLNQHIFKVALDHARVRDDFFVWLAEWFTTRWIETCTVRRCSTSQPTLSVVFHCCCLLCQNRRGSPTTSTGRRRGWMRWWWQSNGCSRCWRRSAGHLSPVPSLAA
jgi:hypothetical protein